MRERMTGRLCRDENCDQLGIHLAHQVKQPTSKETLSKSATLPWERSAPKALDHSIAKATSRVYPRSFDMIASEVKHDYGACNIRTVHRRLMRLVERGHILRVELGRQLYAYVRPGSNMANDITLMREQILEAMVTG